MIQAFIIDKIRREKERERLKSEILPLYVPEIPSPNFNDQCKKSDNKIEEKRVIVIDL